MKKLIIILVVLVFAISSSCSSYHFSTLNHDPIYDDVSLIVPSNVKIDTLSYSQFKRKLRNDFSFRYDFATYAINQPYSWYTSTINSRYWSPFNSFDMYWNRHTFWNDWAFNYPFFGWSSWNYYGYGSYRPWWSRPYSPWDSWFTGPFQNQGYNVVWNSGREIAKIKGRRSSGNLDRVVNKIKTIIKNNPNRSYSNVAINTNLNNNNRNYNNNNNTSNIKYTPRIETGGNSYKPSNNNSSRTTVNSTKVSSRPNRN